MEIKLRVAKELMNAIDRSIEAGAIFANELVKEIAQADHFLRTDVKIQIPEAKDKHTITKPYIVFVGKASIITCYISDDRYSVNVKEFNTGVDMVMQYFNSKTKALLYAGSLHKTYVNGTFFYMGKKRTYEIH